MADTDHRSFTHEQLRTVLDVMHTAVIITDADGSFVVFNKAAERLMGKPAEEVTPAEWANTYGVFHPDRVTPYKVDEYPVSRALEGETVPFEEIFIRNENVPDGIPIHVSAVPLKEVDGRIIGAIATIDDISPLKRVENRLDEVGQQLVRAQKLEAVGRLAGGVAHDFNNHLSVILSLAHMVLEELDEGTPARDRVGEILAAGQRAASLTRQLLALGRRQVASPRVIVADAVVMGVQKLLRRVIGEDIDLRLDLSSEDACVVMDPTHLEQVLMNLAVNARDAMPHGGWLSIETESVDLEEEFEASHFEVRPGPYYSITVSDSGHGMSKDTLAHMFEPFFTTKAAGKGTGLGLSIVHGIVKQAHGHVFVYSEPGHGTTFKLLFPRVDHRPDPVAIVEDVKDVDGNGRAVLLVEDDPQVRDAAASILHSRGFQVHGVGSAEEAREKAVTSGVSYDVLVTDIVLPGLSGPDLAVQLSRMIPGLRVVIMSGYPADALLHRRKDIAKARLLTKPFTPGSLIKAVASVLSPRRGTGEVENTQGSVLLVEDDEALRRVLKTQFEACKFQVREAGSVESALTEFERSALDLVISDVSLPDGDGLGILKSIRSRDMDIPVILMTGEPDVERASEAVRYGAYRYLAKPIPIDELIETARYAVRIGRLAGIKRDALNLIGRDASQPRDLASLELCFESALSNLWVEYQPILRSADKSTAAYEVLVRNGEPALKSPPSLLAAAAALGRLHELGRAIRERAASKLSEAGANKLLFINLHAQDLADPELYSEDAPLTGCADRVVLELTEREALQPGQELETRMRKLRALGYRIAVDDLGAGYSGLASFAQLAPEFVKLDMSLVRDVDANLAKQKTVRAMVELCQSMGIQVVAEGVETKPESEYLLRIGCDYLQGYYFARPSRQLL